jgi:recombination protein RecT
MASQSLTNADDNDKPLVRLVKELSVRADQFAAALPSHISPEKFQRTIVTAVQSDPELLLADRQSLVLACMRCAQDGLLPDKREAALVIFVENKNVGGSWVKIKKVQYMPMVYGLRSKVLRSGEVTDLTVKVVYRKEVEEGLFVYEEGTESMLRHRPLLELAAEDATDSCIVAAYSMATLKDGSKSYEVMRRFEITKVQNVSQTGALVDYKGNAREPKGPWKDWYPEQCKKTVLRRHTKTLPMSTDLLTDADLMSERNASLSAMQLLEVEPVAPMLTDQAPPKRGASADAKPETVEDHDPVTGEIPDDREIAEQLDRETERAVAGETIVAAKPAPDLADFAKRLKRVEIKADFERLDDEFAAFADSLSDDDYMPLKTLVDAGREKFLGGK